jgi:hypothetical protein
MPLTLEEAKSLGVALGVNIPSEVLEAKAKAEEFKTRHEQVSARVGEKPSDWRLKDDFEGLLKQAQESASKAVFDAALKLLDQAEQKLAEPDTLPEPEPAPTPVASTSEAKETDNGKFSIVKLQKSRVAWELLRKTVQAQLQELEQSIIAGVKAHNADETVEEEFDEAQIATAVKQLHKMMEKLDTRLIDKLDEALNAKEPSERESRHTEAAGIIKEYKAFVDGDAMLAEIDSNGFTNSSIRTSVVSTLSELAGNL